MTEEEMLEHFRRMIYRDNLSPDVTIRLNNFLNRMYECFLRQEKKIKVKNKKSYNKNIRWILQDKKQSLFFNSLNDIVEYLGASKAVIYKAYEEGREIQGYFVDQEILSDGF